MRFDLDVKGDKAAFDRLDELSDRAGDIQPVLRRAGVVIQRGLARQFDSKGGHFGGSWPPLAAATLESKARQGLSQEVLVATGALRDSLKGGRGTIFRVAKTQVRVGTKDHRAQFHQAKRPLVGIAPRDYPVIFEILRKHFIV